MKKKIYEGTALDLIQTAYMESHVPLVYCYMELDTAIDISRLKQAVRRTVEIVPQILCRYNKARNAWIPGSYDLCSIVRVVSETDGYEDSVWDVCTDPQLRINIVRQGDGDRLQIAMSHILTDGAGFQQYLALLCKFYNEQEPHVIREVNRRGVTPLPFHRNISRLKDVGYSSYRGTPTLLPVERGQTRLYSLKVTLSEDQFAQVRRKATSLHVTLNDVFMASFAYSLKPFTAQHEIILPCPVDLRPFTVPNDGLTIANMTGKYYCRLSLEESKELKDILRAVHHEMERQKLYCDCFRDIRLLQTLQTFMPVNLLRFITKRRYLVDPISYTNMGTMDEKKIYFKETTVNECYLCGTYRQVPSFQVSISTFKNVCTLAVNMRGTEKQKVIAMRLLNQMKSVLLYEL